MGLWLHNKKYHNEELICETNSCSNTNLKNNQISPNICKYCNKELSCKQSR